MNKTAKCKVQVFGLGGDWGEYLETDSKGKQSTFTRSWYLRPEHLQETIDSGRYDRTEMEGAVLLDIREAVSKDPVLALRVPLVDLLLEEDGVDPFPKEALDSPMTRELLKQWGRGGGSLAVASLPLGGLDKVGLRVFVSWWEQHGARKGTVYNGKVVWFPTANDCGG